MPHFHVTDRLSTSELEVMRTQCDGCDGPRLAEEITESARVWLVTSGAFELRDSAARRVLDPATLMVFPAQHVYTIRHPCGGDVCLSFRGKLAAQLAERGAAHLTPEAGAHARLLAELLAWRRGHGDPFALAEAFCDAGAASAPAPAPGSAAARRDRALTEELCYLIRLHHTESLELSELAERTGTSVFHACRVFRRTTGQAMHQLRAELRLRHALALILDSAWGLAEIAAATGFASQSHLTNRFRDRFGTTPSRARRTPRALVHRS